MTSKAIKDKIAWLRKELAREKKAGNRSAVAVIQRDIAVLEAVKDR